VALSLCCNKLDYLDIQRLSSEARTLLVRTLNAKCALFSSAAFGVNLSRLRSGWPRLPLLFGVVPARGHHRALVVGGFFIFPVTQLSCSRLSGGRPSLATGNPLGRARVAESRLRSRCPCFCSFPLPAFRLKLVLSALMILLGSALSAFLLFSSGMRMFIALCAILIAAVS